MGMAVDLDTIKASTVNPQIFERRIIIGGREFTCRSSPHFSGFLSQGTLGYSAEDAYEQRQTGLAPHALRLYGSKLK